MYFYEVYISDGHDYGGDFKLISKTKYTQEEFENIVVEAKIKCEFDEYDYEMIDKIGEFIVANWDFEKVDCMFVNVLDVQ